MAQLPLTEIIDSLKEAQQNIIHDLCSDWIDEDDMPLLKVQLQLLTTSIANLEILRAADMSPLFRSSMAL